MNSELPAAWRMRAGAGGVAVVSEGHLRTRNEVEGEKAGEEVGSTRSRFTTGEDV